MVKANEICYTKNFTLDNQSGASAVKELPVAYFLNFLIDIKYSYFIMKHKHKC